MTLNDLAVAIITIVKTEENEGIAIVKIRIAIRDFIFQSIDRK